MAKKNNPIITHTEILCLAIRQIESEIKSQESYMGGIPECEAFLENYKNERIHKLEALKEIYQIETGAEYI